MDEKTYPIVAHLRDLRKSVVQALLGIAVGMVVCFVFAGEILKWLRKPMENVLGAKNHFIVISPHEYFFTEMKTALIAGIFLASPWVMYQLWLFIAPGLYRKEKKLTAIFIVATVFFFVAGAYFAYAVVFPPMFQFFIGTLPPDIQGNYSIGMLFGFASNLLLVFGLVFETPILVFVLVLMELVAVEDLSRWRRYVIVITFVVAAILTPTPDPLTQIMMAVPMILLFELGLFAAKLFAKKRVKYTEEDIRFGRSCL